jgi:putative endonuclease
MGTGLRKHMTNKQTTGQRGERTAALFLEEKGYTIIARNVQTPHGEIDLIAEKQFEKRSDSCDSNILIVFVEVKTRTTNTYGPPEVSITPRKQAHLLASIQYYMQQNLRFDVDWRLDVIAIEKYPQAKKATIVHFENAITI